MKTVFRFFLIALLALIIQVNPAMAQKGGHHHGGGGGYKKVYANKPYYNNKVLVVNNGYHPHYYHHPHYYRRVYHPYWGPPVGYYRRWVYFPHYNFYWDNYSSMYIYWGPGGAWVRAATLPPALININISNAKKYELKEDDDKVDDIYDNNASHKKDYPED